MKQISLPVKKRNCPHCQTKETLAYYHEHGESDLYYCGVCHGIVIWTGEELLKTTGEAYPNRDK